MTNKRKLSPFILYITKDIKVFDISKTRTKGTYIENIFETNVLPDEEIMFFYDKYYIGVQKIEALSRIHKCVLSKDFFEKMTKKQLTRYKERSMEHFIDERKKGLEFGSLTLEDYKTDKWIDKTLDSVPRLDIRIWTPFNITEERTQEDIIANIYLDEDGRISKEKYPTQSHSKRLYEISKMAGLSEEELQKENIQEVKRIIAMIAIMKGENVLCNVKN